MLKIVGRITTSKIDYRANFQQRSSLTTFTMDVLFIRYSL